MKKIVDGCTAATYVAYALSDVATIYPITPIASMGETANKWAVAGVKNVFGQPMQVHELESELGAAGATHGALVAGALATTFTSSQGLLLMIPNMYKISGELLPAVFHVGTRSLATHALSIFGDHQDVMACRSTGFAFLSSASVQETMDLALVAHLAAIKGRVPVCHFFDGWRTSNEMSTIDMIPYEQMLPLVDRDAVDAFRRRGMNPEHPDLRGSAQNPDVYFQNREAANSYYDAFPAIVQEQMDKVGELTGRHYRLFDYEGAPDADTVVIAMGSATQVLADTSAWLNAHGYKTGVVKVRLYRPFSADALMAAIPATVKNIAVLDRTKDPGANGEPLYVDVAVAVLRSGRMMRVVGGRYGLGSKEFDPSMAKAVFDNAAAEEPVRDFTVGIDDDVTHRSLAVTDRLTLDATGVTKCIFFGIGADGTVGATKMAASIFGDSDGMYAQAYFTYSAKKSGGYTRCQLRLSPQPVTAEYSIEEADYVGCNKDTYVRRFRLVDNLREGGVFVLNSSWTAEQMEQELPPSLRRAIALKKARFYNVDAVKISVANGLGVRINTVMETVFLKLIALMDFDKAVAAFKEHITAMYAHEGMDVVKRNLAAVDAAVDAIVPIDYPASWSELPDEDFPSYPVNTTDAALKDFVEKVARPCLDLEGDSLPVSALSVDGTMPMGTTAFEKRAIAIDVPQWRFETCVECTDCSLVCPHAAIRPVVLDSSEAKAAPADLTSKPAWDPALKGMNFRIQVYPEDCTGCGSCALICPGHALFMEPLASQRADQARLLAYCQDNITIKDNLVARNTINGSQLQEPMLEFSGACAGCGETPYVKLVTQLFGERMVIANATGCSSIWGANFPSNAYCTNRHGKGAAWGNSLFEDNAEYGYGMAVAFSHRRQALTDVVRHLVDDREAQAAQVGPMFGEVLGYAQAWLDAVADPVESQRMGDALVGAIRIAGHTPSADMQYILDHADMLGKKSVWVFGGDGWAYDIGFAGLDHVLAQNVDINMLVLDTECYSNTGGQMSKATPHSAVVKYAAEGKRTYKKDLGRMMMTYGNVYVAQVALGANYQMTIDALVEAESYPGPSIVICYCPCIEHGIRTGLGHSILEEREAVASGYWPIYRYDPRAAAQGRNPLTVDAPSPDGNLITFINGEDRYADLRMTDPRMAAILQPQLHDHCDDLHTILLQQQNLK